ncbi:phytyl ester synthase 1, chloroplastic [Impatiens glandulifera]|uniref:phytyl ester synthase 1, chloroplastic n=1 Tax=Impatiens glandulifera TaxID=253017 RepID=UPI001FB0CA9B|nr:phytyl ester synthase 1, chloroplastic [Impatiens glandulifera]
MASLARAFWSSPHFVSSTSSDKKSSRFGIRVQKGDSAVASEDSIGVERESLRSFIDVGNGKPGLTSLRKRKESTIAEKLGALWDDGYGSNTIKDYLDNAKDFIKPDGGPPRWFCPIECGQPLKNSPILLFLPGMDGLGLGLLLHHKALGKVFEVRCLHIPVYDRTPFEGLVKFVENSLRTEHASSPDKPIYLVGDSFGGCLALTVAARNPNIDLVVVLANPASSFGRSQLSPLLPLLEAMPDEIHFTIPYLLSFVMGEPFKMATVSIERGIPPTVALQRFSDNLTALLPRLSALSDIIPKETLLWKLKLLKSAAAYTNSRLHSITAEVLVLAGGKDNMLPSGNEAVRLRNSIKNCSTRYFKDNGHTILLEDGVNLLTMIKATCKYRRSRKHDFVTDFIPPSHTEFQNTLQNNWLLNFATSPVMLSTMEDGKIVRGLAGVPDEGPVLLVGYHMLMGLELVPLIEGFLLEKNVLVRGIAHPELFSDRAEIQSKEFSFIDMMKVYGALPVSASNMFKLFSTKSHVLLYPGGALEALHRKGDEYKLSWPDQPEFVRMAARFGATIVPFGVVGEDDLAELVLDYDDMIKIPVLGDYLKSSQDHTKFRDVLGEDRANQELYIPGILPKIPGRIYFLFGKPIQTKGKEYVLKDRENAREVYLQIKSEVEGNMAYLIKKREEDPYRGVFERVFHQANSTPGSSTPTFEP